MELGSVLQTLGSIASLAAIPLSIYLYLRSREARVAQLRREVVRILSYQIGEGRQLTPFEISAVISSKSREHGIRGGIVSRDQIIEDLIADAVMNPMLESSKKALIVGNLQCIHDLGPMFRLVQLYPVRIGQLARWLGQHHALAPEDLVLAEPEKDAGTEPQVTTKTSDRESLSSLFARVATLVSVVSFIGIQIGMKEGAFPLRLPSPYLEIFAGVLSSLVAALLMATLQPIIKIFEKGRSSRDESAKRG